MAAPATLARPWAKAVLAAAVADGSAPRWSRMLAFCAAVVAVPDMAVVLRTPGLDRQAALEVMLRLGAELVDRPGRNLLRALAAAGRLALLPAIAQGFEALRAQAEGRGTAAVTSARPLSPERQAALRQALEARFGLALALNCRVDPDLLGGAVLRVGDLVMDGSAAGRLRQLELRLT